MKPLQLRCFAPWLLAGVLACGSPSDSQTTASTTPTEEHHGEGHHGEGHHGHGASTDATVVPPGEATVGDTTTCPVTKETFVVQESSPKAEHEGKTYYFCCPGCAGAFEEDPSKFVSASDDASS